ncbi:hypothetical protein [Psychrobacter sp.]|uniref:hypothetical protein n=1 Tax=Psychrobacter sp. TaxID=56811 RepID=UPI003BAF11C1
MSYFTIVISVFSLVIATFSVSMNLLLWRKVNRPIVTVRLSSNVDSTIALNMIIENTGNLPAKGIRLLAKREDVLNCVNGSAIPQEAERIFFENTMIPILANGKKTTNSFNFYGQDIDGCWESGSYLPIRIEYYALGGRKYNENFDLRFASDNEFAFSSWGSLDKT